MKSFVLAFLLSAAAYSQPLTISNLVPDDEGVKVLAQSLAGKMTVVYLSQNHQSFNKYFEVLKQAKQDKTKLEISTTKADIALITKIEVK